MNLSVTKFGSSVRLHFVTPNLDVFSIPFNVDVGAPGRIHLTVRGTSAKSKFKAKTWTPGTYPGNSGTPPITTAGQAMVVEARITDRRWNLISGGGSAYNMQITNNLPNHYLVGSNPNVPGPIYTFPNDGEFGYDPNPAFDKSFRVYFRTAGPNASLALPAPQIRVTSNLSANAFLSSTMTVLPGAYSNLVLVAPGETIRPGIDTGTSGKQGAPTSRQAGIGFGVTGHDRHLLQSHHQFTLSKCHSCYFSLASWLFRQRFSAGANGKWFTTVYDHASKRFHCDVQRRRHTCNSASCFYSWLPGYSIIFRWTPSHHHSKRGCLSRPRFTLSINLEMSSTKPSRSRSRRIRAQPRWRPRPSRW